MDTEFHWFWWLLTWACVVWYSSITLYVAYRGVADVKRLLQRLVASGVPDELPAASADAGRDGK